MKILLCGGDRSGKSDYAQQLAVALAKGGAHYYVATMIPTDEEDHARIRSHLKRREGMGFETLVCGRNLPACLSMGDPKGTYMLDSITALMTNELFRPEKNYQPDEADAEKCIADLCTFLQQAENAVLVTDNIFCDCADYSEETELYRRSLGRANRTAAQLCDTVIEMTAGIPLVLKGKLPHEENS